MRTGYSIRRIKDICDKGSSNVAQKDLEGHDGKYPIYGASGFIKNVDFYHQDKEYVGIVKDGSGIGRVAFYPPKSSLIGTLQYIIPKEGYDIRYVGYCLQSLDLSSYRQGAAIPHIYFRDYGEREVFVAKDKEEQQRIVDILDREFAKIDALKANAEKSLQAAKDLFQATLKKELEPKEGWNILPLSGIVDEGSHISYGIVQPGDDFPGGVPVVRPVDLTSPVLRSTSTFKKTRPEISQAYRRSILTGKEILLCVRGTTGVLSLSSGALKGCNTTRGIVPLCVADDTKRQFVYYALLSPACQKFIAEYTNGTALKQINIADVKNIPVPVAPKKEQEIVVSILDELTRSSKKLQENYQKTLTLCDDLKQSLLRKAFIGEL